LGVGEARVSWEARRMHVRDEETPPVRALDLHDLADAALPLPPARQLRIELELAAFLLTERVRVERDHLALAHGDVCRHQDDVALAAERRAEQPGVERGDPAAERSSAARAVTDSLHVDPAADLLERP